MSNRKQSRIKLTNEERATFEAVSKGRRGKLTIAAWKIQRAKSMLMCDESESGPGWGDVDIAEAVGASVRSIENWRKLEHFQNRCGGDCPFFPQENGTVPLESPLQ